MLPPKIGDGVVGSNSGGVKPTGASFFAGTSVLPSVLPSAAETFTVLWVENFRDLGVVKVEESDCFHGTETWLLDFGAERVGVKSVAWVAMAMKKDWSFGGREVCFGVWVVVKKEDE